MAKSDPEASRQLRSIEQQLAVAKRNFDKLDISKIDLVSLGEPEGIRLENIDDVELAARANVKLRTGNLVNIVDLANCDLHGQDLSRVNFAGKTLRGATLTNATFTVEGLTGATLVGADLRGVKVSGRETGRLDPDHFQDVKLSAEGTFTARLIANGADLSRVEFYDVVRNLGVATTLAANVLLFAAPPGHAVKLENILRSIDSIGASGGHGDHTATRNWLMEALIQQIERRRDHELEVTPRAIELLSKYPSCKPEVRERLSSLA